MGLMRPGNPEERFRRAVTPHVDAAYNLARWLLNDPHDAEDAVQDAAIRAFSSISSLREVDGKTWFLTIVRNTCMNKMRSMGSRHRMEFEAEDELENSPAPAPNPEELLLRAHDAQRLQEAIGALPPALREALILREFEGLSYREISSVTETAIGTVMSRLSRARRLLCHTLQYEEGT